MTGLGAYDDRDIYRPYDAAALSNFAGSKIAIDINGVVQGYLADGVTLGGTNFLTGMPLGSAVIGGSVLPGDQLVVNGVEYKIVFSATATDADTCIVCPKPTAAVAATSTWLIVRTDTVRATII